jgi:hypothetical protein
VEDEMGVAYKTNGEKRNVDSGKARRKYITKKNKT